MSSQLGTIFRITTFGESHGGGVGVVIDGCPPRLALDAADIQRDLDRRRPGQSRLTTPRQEADRVEILSGVFEGRTLGSPIALLVRNEDARPEAYAEMKDLYRPSHADYTTEAKYGIRNWQGGGRASARETIGRVAAGAIARQAARRGRERRGARVGRERPHARREGGCRERDARAGRGEPRALPGPRGLGAHGGGDRRGAPPRRLARRRGRVRGARRPAGPRRAGLRQARGRSRAGPALAAGLEGLRDRQRLRRHAHDGHRAQRRLRAGRRRASAHRDEPLRRDPGRHQQRRAHRAARRLQAHRDDPARAGHRGPRQPGLAASPPAAATTPACCRAPCRWSRRWCCLVLADHWLRQRAVDALP